MRFLATIIVVFTAITPLYASAVCDGHAGGYPVPIGDGGLVQYYCADEKDVKHPHGDKTFDREACWKATLGGDSSCYETVMYEAFERRRKSQLSAWAELSMDMRSAIWEGSAKLYQCDQKNIDNKGGVDADLMRTTCLSEMADAGLREGVLAYLDGKKKLSELSPSLQTATTAMIASKCGKSPSESCLKKIRKRIVTSINAFDDQNNEALLQYNLMRECSRPEGAWPAKRCAAAYNSGWKKFKDKNKVDSIVVLGGSVKYLYEGDKPEGGGGSEKKGGDEKPQKKKAAKPAAKPAAKAPEPQAPTKPAPVPTESPPPDAPLAPVANEAPPDANNKNGCFDDECPEEAGKGSRADNVLGSPLLGDGASSGTGEYSGRLLSCVWAFYADPKNHKPWMSEFLICNSDVNTDLIHFTDEMKKVAFYPSVDGCFDILRMVGTTRFMEARRRLSGEDISEAEFPASCAPLSKGIKRYREKPMPSPRLIEAEPYRKELQRQAKTIRLGVEAASDLDAFSGLPQCMERHDPKICTSDMSLITAKGDEARAKCARAYNVSRMGKDPLAFAREQLRIYRAAQGDEQFRLRTKGIGCRRVSEILPAVELKQKFDKAIKKRFMKYPLLGAGYNPRTGVWEKRPKFLDGIADAKNDAQLTKALAEPIKIIEGEQVKQLGNFCKFGPNDWKSLVGMSELVAEATRHAPQCGPVYDCAKKEKAAEASALSTLTMVFTMSACLVGSLTPAAPVVAPACAAYFIGEAYVEYKHAERDMKHTYNCIMANASNPDWKNSVCNDKDYEAATAKYEAAVGNLILNTAFAGLEGVMLLKHAGPFLKPKQLEDLAARLAKANAQGDTAAVKKLMAEIDTLTNGKAAESLAGKGEFGSPKAEVPGGAAAPAPAAPVAAGGDAGEHAAVTLSEVKPQQTVTFHDAGGTRQGKVTKVEVENGQTKSIEIEVEGPNGTVVTETLHPQKLRKKYKNVPDEVMDRLEVDQLKALEDFERSIEKQPKAIRERLRKENEEYLKNFKGGCRI